MQGFEWKVTAPDEAGIDPQAVAILHDVVQSLIDRHVVPGAVSAVVHRRRLVWYEAQGFRDPIAQVPMCAEDIFRIMSSTKPVTAAAVLMMQDEGHLSIDDPVSRFLPTFALPRVVVPQGDSGRIDDVRIVAAERELTIRDLLTHTSGLIDDPGLVVPFRLNEPLTRKDLLERYVARLGSAVLAYQPGTRWHYSPLFAMDTLLRIVEIASGMPGDRFLRERLFDPLGMPDTGFIVPQDQAHRLVGIHQHDGSAWVRREDDIVGDMLPRPPSTPYLSGGGGLFSTVRDYMQFQLMLLNDGEWNGHRLLRPESVAAMRSNHVGDMMSSWLPIITEGYGMGLGVRVVQDESKAPAGRPVGAFGWPGAYGTDAFSAPSIDVAAAIFVQVQPINFSVGTAFGGAVGRAFGPTRTL